MTDDVFDEPGGYDWQAGTVDTTGVSEADLSSGGGVSVGGKYHFHIATVTPPKAVDPEDRNPPTPSWRFDCEVLDADYPEASKTQVGKIHFHKVYVAKKAYEEVDGKKEFLRFDPPAPGSVKSMLRFAQG